MPTDADFLSDHEKRPLTDQEVKELFGTASAPGPAPHTFELALVLGGTVSAGGYTAGALDFLIEALDAWDAARSDPNVPQHRVVLRVITGTSGGGVNAAIAARALNFKFDPISSTTNVDNTNIKNPFYETWVRDLTLSGFLGTDDLANGLTSILDSDPIDRTLAKLIAFTGHGPLNRPRQWLAEPLRLILTLTNLRGMPYLLPFGTGLGELFVDHADFIRFALCYDGQTPGQFRPDELVLGFVGPNQFNLPPSNLPQPTDWADFAQFACGTAAFPAGFRPRPLKRPTLHYRYRVVRNAPANRQATIQEYQGQKPDWHMLGGDRVPRQYDFLTVDGGVADNEPIELARTALCGVDGTNPRDAAKANRAVLLIDPFAGENTLGPAGAEALKPVLGAIFTTVTQQTRYDTSDLVLAADPDILSRFMIVPRRVDSTGKHFMGSQAIASAGISAFIGFAAPEFMRHDYFLGRRNCQDFLRKTFRLDPSNPVFVNGNAAPGEKRPVIPLCGSAAVEQPLPKWPVNALNPENYRRQIKNRFRGVLGTQGFLGRAAAVALQQWLAREAIGSIDKYLDDAKLR
jgi:hypothetical protein